MGSILLKNIAVEEVASNILIEDGLISKVVPVDVEVAVPEGAEVVDCTGKAAFPGFVNMHTHAGMALMKGIGEDIAFHEWLDKIWQAEEHLDEEYVYHATKAACLEMIKTGTT
jgi:5-methylthioadenosine/S-adenosylhomocysteine deaminase